MLIFINFLSFHLNNFKDHFQFKINVFVILGSYFFFHFKFAPFITLLFIIMKLHPNLPNSDIMTGIKKVDNSKYVRV